MDKKAKIGIGIIAAIILVAVIIIIVIVATAGDKKNVTPNVNANANKNVPVMVRPNGAPNANNTNRVEVPVTNGGGEVVVITSPNGGEAPTETDPYSGEPLFNCRCENMYGCEGGAIRGDKLLNIPLSLVPTYDDCSSGSNWFCCTTEDCSHYCKLY
jgi:hypothetical protein